MFMFNKNCVFNHRLHILKIFAGSKWITSILRISTKPEFWKYEIGSDSTYLYHFFQFKCRVEFIWLEKKKLRWWQLTVCSNNSWEVEALRLWVAFWNSVLTPKMNCMPFDNLFSMNYTFLNECDNKEIPFTSFKKFNKPRA